MLSRVIIEDIPTTLIPVRVDLWRQERATIHTGHRPIALFLFMRWLRSVFKFFAFNPQTPKLKFDRKVTLHGNPLAHQMSIFFKLGNFSPLIYNM